MIIALIALSAFACFKWGDWRNWREYYATILFLIIGNLAYDFVFHDYSLWCYSGCINHTVSNLLVMFLLYPCVVILFLTYWPDKKFFQMLYVLAWSVGGTLLELLGVGLKCFSYFNGWNIFYSFVVYIVGFILIRVHLNHPLIVWPICIVFAIATMLIFKFPFEQIK